MLFGRQSDVARKGWFRKTRPPALALVREAVDRVVDRDRDRLLRDLHQRHARHAPRRGRARTPDPGKSRSRHRCRHQPQYRALRSVAARRRQQSGDAGDQGRQQGDPAPDPVRSRRYRQAFRRDPGVRRAGQTDPRCGKSRSGAGEPRRRGVFPGPSRQSRSGPVHEPPDVAPRRLFGRAQPAHHRCRWSLFWCRGRLDPLQLFP